MDGCAIKKGNKCDNLLKEGKRDEEGPEYYVELKGEDVGHALEQIKQTIHTIHNDHSPMMAFIICTNVSPSLSTKIQQFKSQLKKKYNATLVIKERQLELEEQNIKQTEKQGELRISNSIDTEIELKQKITKLPTDKVPVIIAGGSFNTKGRETVPSQEGLKVLKEFIKKVDNNNVYFVIGHQMQGYEKAIIDISKELNKKFEINAIVPKVVTENDPA